MNLDLHTFPIVLIIGFAGIVHEFLWGRCWRWKGKRLVIQLALDGFLAAFLLGFFAVMVVNFPLNIIGASVSFIAAKIFSKWVLRTQGLSHQKTSSS